jgi:hypothetical protein
MEKRKVKFTNPDPLASTHYICIGGCGLVSNEPMKCNILGCPRNRNPLSECQCEDGTHADIPILGPSGYAKEIEELQTKGKK